MLYHHRIGCLNKVVVKVMLETSFPRMHVTLETHLFVIISCLVLHQQPLTERLSIVDADYALFPVNGRCKALL